MDLLIKISDVQIAFGFLTHCFMQHPSYLLQCTPPFSTFINPLISFGWTYSLISLPSLSIIFPNCFHNILYVTWTTPSFNYEYPLMCVHTSHWPYGYPPLMLCSWEWTHWNPWRSLQHLYCHCIRCWLPCGTKKLHVLPSTMFNSSHCRANVMFTKDGICTLADVIIINPTWTNLLPRSW